MADLYFLAARSPPGATEGPYSPCRLKATKSAELDPLVAFATKPLGALLMVGRGIGSECSILRFSEFDPSIAADARSRPVLFFDTSDSVARFLEQGPEFDFGAHVTSFENAHAHAERAL